MLMRTLGQTNMHVAALCLGGNTFGWTTDDQTSFAVLDTYVEGGGNFIDTADVYSTWVPGHEGGESEAVLGRWIKARGIRDRVILATKVGSRMNNDPARQGLSRQYILRAVEDSLRRLQTDYIDLYQSHRDDLDTPLEETLATFNELVQQGKVRAIGASNYSTARLADALKVSDEHGYARYQSMQPPYSLVNRGEYEGELQTLCLQQELSVITYSSLASGFLSGKYRRNQNLPPSPRAKGIQQRYMNEYGFRVLAEVDRVAHAHNATPTQVALAWLLAQPGITAPIASATSVQQTRELLAAVSLKLTDEEIQSLNQVSV